MKSPFAVLQSVLVTEDLPGLPAGTVAAIVEVLDDTTCEIEVTGPDGSPTFLGAVPFSALGSLEGPFSDAALKRLFWDQRLGSKQWTHSLHLRMAWLLLEDHSVDEAHILIRVGIIRLNAAHGLVETPARGYHDTLTRVWLLLVATAKAENRGADSAEFLELHSGALCREAPLRHYSRERLYSVRARAHFVEPDLEPLPHG